MYRPRKHDIPQLENMQYIEVVNETDLTSVYNLNIMDMEMVLENDTGQHFPSDNCYSTCDKETNTSPSSLQEAPKMIDKKTSVSPERIWNCSTAKLIQKANLATVRSLKRKMKVLEQKVREKNNKILIMKSILDELKIDYISDED